MRYPSADLFALRQYFGLEFVSARRLSKDGDTSLYAVTLSSGFVADIYIIRRDGDLLLFEPIF